MTTFTNWVISLLGGSHFFFILFTRVLYHFNHRINVWFWFLFCLFWFLILMLLLCFFFGAWRGWIIHRHTLRTRQYTVYIPIYQHQHPQHQRMNVLFLIVVTLIRTIFSGTTDHLLHRKYYLLVHPLSSPYHHCIIASDQYRYNILVPVEWCVTNYRGRRNTQQ